MRVKCKEWNILAKVGDVYEVEKIVENEFGDKFYELKGIKYGQVAVWCFDIVEEEQ